MFKWLAFAFNFLLAFILLFVLEKGIFLLYFLHKTAILPFADITGIFIHGLWLDISLSCYLLACPLLVFMLQQISGKRIMSVFLKIYFFIIFFIIGLLFVGDLGIYANWASKLNVRAIQNILHPTEMMASAGNSPVWLYVLLIIAHVLFFRPL